LVLNATTIAFDAAASMMSLSVTSPAASCRTVDPDLVLSELLKGVVMAPSEPDTSA